MLAEHPVEIFTDVFCAGFPSYMKVAYPEYCMNEVGGAPIFRYNSVS